MYLTGDILN